MRIAMVSPVLGDAFGQERVMRDSTHLLRKHGHQVFFLGEVVKGELPPHDGHKLIPGLTRLHPLRSLTEAKRATREATSFLRSEKLDVVHFIDQLPWICQKEIVNHFPSVMTSHLLTTTCPASTRHVVSQNDYCRKESGFSCLLHNKTQKCLSHLKDDVRRAHAVMEFIAQKKSLKNLRAMVAISRFVKDMLELDGWPKEKIRLIYNPITLPHAPKPAGSTPPKIACVSRLELHKGIDVLIRALKEVESHAWELSLCGEGSQAEPLKKLAHELGLSSRIHFLGKTPYEKTQALVNASTLLVQPNRGPEPFGLSVAEANALGTPVVAADLPALNEIILNQETGLLFRPGDSKHLSEKILQLLQDEKLRNQLSAHGLQRVKLEFSPEMHLTKTLALYKELI